MFAKASMQLIYEQHLKIKDREMLAIRQEYDKKKAENAIAAEKRERDRRYQMKHRAKKAGGAAAPAVEEEPTHDTITAGLATLNLHDKSATDQSSAAAAHVQVCAFVMLFVFEGSW